jgi:hypothetical protein
MAKARRVGYSYVVARRRAETRVGESNSELSSMTLGDLSVVAQWLPFRCNVRGIEYLERIPEVFDTRFLRS